MLHASSGVWQVAQLRPFVPWAWKYLPVRSMWPRTLNVADFPPGFFCGWLFGMLSWRTAAVAPARSEPRSEPSHNAKPSKAPMATTALIRQLRFLELCLFMEMSSICFIEFEFITLFLELLERI